MAAKKKNVTSAQLGLGALTSTPSPASVPVNPNRLPEDAVVDVRAPEPSRGLSLPLPAHDPLPGHLDSASSESTSTVVMASAAADLDLESFDDYDDGAVVDSVPRLHLVDPPAPSPRVIVEAVGEVFEVSRLRDGGTTVACVMWTRSELEELQRRITAALEMGK